MSQKYYLCSPRVTIVLFQNIHFYILIFFHLISLIWILWLLDSCFDFRIHINQLDIFLHLFSSIWCRMVLNDSHIMLRTDYNCHIKVLWLFFWKKCICFECRNLQYDFSRHKFLIWKYLICVFNMQETLIHFFSIFCAVV